MNLYKWRFAICGHSPEESLGDILKNSCPEKFQNLGLTRTLWCFLWIFGNVSEQLFSGKRMKGCFRISTMSHAGRRAYVKVHISQYFYNPKSYSKACRTSKKTELVLYNTCLIYSIIKLSSLWYRIKRYFPMKRKCTEKLTWMIVLQLNVGYLRWTKWICFLSTFTE